MKTTRLFTNLTLAMAVCLSVTSCLKDEDTYRAGFYFSNPTTSVTGIYANTTTDSLVIQCLGPWKITADTPEATWCTLASAQGPASYIYSTLVNFEQNTTGKSRIAQFTIKDTDHPDDAHATWQYWQFATRGDGSLGNAPLVKRIQSTDGYVANIEYDAKSRPVKYTLTNTEASVSELLTIDYDEANKLLTVNNRGNVLTGSMDKGYQPRMLTSATDTIGYYSQYYPNGMPVSANYAFNFFANSSTRGFQGYYYLLNGQSLAPDSLHNADSLMYQRRWKADGQLYIEKLDMQYSQMDNRCQSVDVNQLLLGFAECHPMQLLSLFSYSRSTNIVSRATSTDGAIEVTTQLNANKSVKEMTIRDARKGTETTYTFEY